MNNILRNLHICGIWAATEPAKDTLSPVSYQASKPTARNLFVSDSSDYSHNFI